MSTAVVRTVPELEPLAAEWQTLEAAVRRPLLGYDWARSCAAAFSTDGGLRIVTARRGGQLVGVAPLVARGPWLEFIGMSSLYEPCDCLASDDEALHAVLAVATRLGAPLLLQRLEAQSAVPAALGAVMRQPRLLLRRPAAPLLSVAIEGTWDDYYRTLSSRITGNLARLRRKAAAAFGPVTIDVLRPDEHAVPGLLDHLVEVEHSGWKGAAGTSLRHNGRLLAFFRDYAAREARRGRLRVAQLRFGDRLAAVELAVEAFGAWWQLKIGFADPLASYYPGLQLTEATIRYAFQQRLERYEFLGVAAEWETRWRPESRATTTVVAYPPTLSAARALSADVWRAARHRLPWSRMTPAATLTSSGSVA